MRLRALAGWATTVLSGTLGCGQTSGTNDTGSGAGGNGPEPDPGVGAMSLDYVRSGTRVVALGYSSNEARVFRTFHDQQLGFDCNFVPDAEGRSQRCVPNLQVRLVYTDADCKEPAAWIERWGGVEVAAVGDAVTARSPLRSESCPGDLPEHAPVYRVAEKLAEEAIAISELATYEPRDGKCQPAQIPAKVVPATYRLVPLPEGELARGERVSVKVSDGLRLTRLIADDGAELNVGVTGADKKPCALQRDGECVPEPIAQLQLVNDGGHAYAALNSDCSAPAFTLPYPSACGSGKFGVEDDGVSPPKVRALEALTGYFSWDLVLPVTEPISFACQSRPLSAGDRVWAPGRDVTGTLPTATKLRRGTGPLHVDWFAVGQRELWPAYVGYNWASPGVPTGEFMNDAGKVCSIRTADDGSFRCAELDTNGEAAADLKTFPEVVAFTY